uniref:CRAL-TRIO domain-containing protein n=1 Tax=Phaeocystis antarctica TaxID=33657 RepID=A0A7S0HB85_9EUKA|mmetsp:Transcript_17867/g.42365  ORF Transcript_17867/g.42365 Transcript_17867/m.42365 type:complete len:278 (+) Transcript_17867:49-882(+)
MGEEVPASALELQQLQRELVRKLLAAVSEEPGAEWADEDVCARYLVARNNRLDKATTMLKETLRWRHSFGVSKLGERHAVIRTESETGKLRVSDSVDRAGRPVLVMTPRAENTSDHDGQILNLVYHLERATGGRGPVDGAADGKLVTVIDFKGWSLRNAAPMKTSRATLSILQNHYPERLHRFLLLNVPTLFTVLWNAMNPFIDPVTRAKIVFVTGSAEQQQAALRECFDLAQLEEGLGGLAPLHWDPAAYFARDAELASAGAGAAVPASARTAAAS